MKKYNIWSYKIEVLKIENYFSDKSIIKISKVNKFGLGNFKGFMKIGFNSSDWGRYDTNSKNVFYNEKTK